MLTISQANCCKKSTTEFLQNLTGCADTYLTGHLALTLELPTGFRTILGGKFRTQLSLQLRRHLNRAIQRTAGSFRRTTATAALHRLQQILTPERRTHGLGTIIAMRRATEYRYSAFSSVHNAPIITGNIRKSNRITHGYRPGLRILRRLQEECKCIDLLSYCRCGTQ